VLSARVRPVRHAERVGLVDRNGGHVIESVAGVVVGHLLPGGGRLVRDLHHRREGALRAGRTGSVKLAERVRLLLRVAGADGGCRGRELVSFIGSCGIFKLARVTGDLRGLAGAP
jgi:hypothetical protein